ncbi:winged helix-turn-helix domain-containing protein [Paenibacillus sp. 1001270B_150601_E10]|uniref:winged helix-turn-helix domain-containing protein n=1 Tax=Paenibacillus sp. 1001270B_150601_E10 TaxID=2787079 RepID=UPI00189F20E7|nr:response regulator transcription factor [Paenibacillus sp. 1001270B_150601_E10]
MSFQPDQLFILNYEDLSNERLQGQFTKWLSSVGYTYAVRDWEDISLTLFQPETNNSSHAVIVLLQGRSKLNPTSIEDFRHLVQTVAAAIRLHPLPIGFVLVTQRPTDPCLFSLLDEGLDDMIEFPCKEQEWGYRLKKSIRSKCKSNVINSDALIIGDLTIDPAKRLVYRDNEWIELTPREYELLHILASHVDTPLSRSYLMEKIWNIDFETNTNIVDVYVRYLRQKIDRGRTHKLIRTVRGYGYKLVGPTA